MAVVPTYLISHRDFFPLLPPSSKSHQKQPPQSATGPCLGTHTKAHNRLTNTRVEKLVDIQAYLRLFEPDNETPSTSLESYSEDEASV